MSFDPPVFNLLAEIFMEYPKSSIAFSTLFLVSGRMLPEWLMTLETVFMET